ncbi:P2Y purinoceptor 2 [Biomphalaria glabrata]
MLNFSSTKTLFWKTIFPDDNVFYFTFWFGQVAMNCLTAFTILSNIVNMIVFERLDITNRVNFTLFCLSWSDLLGAFFLTIMTVGYAGDVQLGSFVLDGYSLQTFVWTFRTVCVDLSSGLTIFISIERCICVTRPFFFNTSFIARHGKKIVVITIVFFIFYYLPIGTGVYFRATFNGETNTTKYFMIFTDLNISYQKFNDSFMGSLVFVVGPILAFICSVLLLRGLKRSSAVRMRNAESTHFVQPCNGQYLSNKERRMVKMVFVLTWLYLVSTLPQGAAVVIYDYYHTYDSEEKETETRNLILIVEPLNYYITCVYGAFSFFVYYFFNSSYRNKFHKIFLL